MGSHIGAERDYFVTMDLRKKLGEETTKAKAVEGGIIALEWQQQQQKYHLFGLQGTSVKNFLKK